MKSLAVIFTIITILGTTAAAQQVRPPAVPLITHDPYLSIWSFANQLTNQWPKHWTGSIHAMSGLVQIDGKPYRFMGPAPKDVPPLKQESVTVQPTQTIYKFSSPEVELNLRFVTPALCDDIELLSRPLTYIEFEARALDGAPHEVKVYFDASSELAVNTPEQEVTWTRAKSENLQVMRIGTIDQPVLETKGDNVRIDWGHLYIAAPDVAAVDTVMASADAARTGFVQNAQVPASDELHMPRTSKKDFTVLACTWDLGKVAEDGAEGHVLIAYDDLYSIELLQRRLRPYWRKDGTDAMALLEKGEAEREEIKVKCEQFDRQLIEKLTAIGGEEYAEICALAYRQCLAAGKVVADFDGTPLLFSKENFSNGCIATVDVIYPASPFFLAFNPELLKAQLTPLLDYAASNRWKFPYAPHDMGKYPQANGQAYGGGELTEDRQMPVEECGNMLIMMAALAKTDGNADYAKAHLPLLRQWADYLTEGRR